MTMSLLARLGGSLVGPAGYIVLALSLIVSLYHNFNTRQEAREDRIETAATNQCNAGWLVAVAKRKQRDAEAKALSAQELIEGERRVNEDLTNDLSKIRQEHAALLERASAGPDPKCLSDGMLESLRRRGVVGPGAKGSGGGQGRQQ